MKFYKLIISFIILSALVVSASSLKDVEFKNMKGDTYSFKELADQGKHVYFLMSFDGWSGCEVAVLLFNEIWETYGCEKCDDYECFTMIVHWPEDYSHTMNWMTTFGQTCPGVCAENGGLDISDAVNFYGGGTTYMLHPDYSWVETTTYGDERDITSRGIQPHICKVTSNDNQNFSDKIRHPGLSVEIYKNNLNIKVPDAGFYQVSIFTLNGRLIKSFDLQLNEGVNNIFFADKPFSNSLFIVDVKGVSQNKKNYNFKKVVCELK